MRFLDTVFRRTKSQPPNTAAGTYYKGLAAKSTFKKIGGGGMIRHRLLCLGYFDFGSVGLFSLGFLSFFAVQAQHGQNAAADKEKNDPKPQRSCVAGLRNFDGVLLCGFIGVVIAAVCAAGVSARIGAAVIG